jgi:hypothetical protein
LLDELDKAVIGNFVDDNNGSAAPNNQAGIYSESANDAALRFGSRFTTKHYHRTKLFKILSDANASHYLYKEIFQRGCAAQNDNYDFNPIFLDFLEMKPKRVDLMINLSLGINRGGKICCTTCHSSNKLN